MREGRRYSTICTILNTGLVQYNLYYIKHKVGTVQFVLQCQMVRYGTIYATLYRRYGTISTLFRRLNSKYNLPKVQYTLHWQYNFFNIYTEVPYDLNCIVQKKYRVQTYNLVQHYATGGPARYNFLVRRSLVNFNFNIYFTKFLRGGYSSESKEKSTNLVS